VPDLVTHAAVAWISGVRLLDRTSVGWLTAGALLPDLASRLPRVLLHGLVELGVLDSRPGMLRLLFGLEFPHTPVGVVVTAVFVAAILPELLCRPLPRRRLVGLLCAGGALHLAVDALQTHIEPSYYWLYPFSMWRGELALVATDASLFAMPFLLALAWLATPSGGRSEERPPPGG
jgi:hypothetical protein